MPNLFVSACHYETPLRRRGNLTNLVAYEIASIVPLSRNDTTTNLIRRMDSRALQGIFIKPSGDADARVRYCIRHIGNQIA